MDSFKKSENYAKLSKNDTATAVTYMDLANVYSTNEDYKKAFLYFNKSVFITYLRSSGLAELMANRELEYNRVQ